MIAITSGLSSENKKKAHRPAEAESLGHIGARRPGELRQNSAKEAFPDLNNKV